MKLAGTPITSHSYNGHSFFLKRDDLLHPQFSGNKARKLMSLLELDSAKLKTIIGHGSAQSNAMYSLAALAKMKGWQAEFIVDHVPQWLRENPLGNYRESIALGMKITALKDITPGYSLQEYLAHRELAADELFIPEGGRSPIAEAGVNILAKEILQWKSDARLEELTVALPSGTGTTALYLSQTLKPLGIEVITCACVGGNDYLTAQFEMLKGSHHPTIIQARDKHHFAKLYRDDYITWLNLTEQTGVVFDLIYDPYMWLCLEGLLSTKPINNLLYIHQGGLLGNESMLPRYQRKYPDLTPN